MSSTTFRVPSVVPRDDERDRVADALRNAVGTGLLSLEQFEERLRAAYAATTLTELQGLIPWVNPPHRPARTRRYWRLAVVPLLFTSFALVRFGITSVDR